MNPSNRMAETQINFNIKVIVDPCLLTTLKTVKIQNMEFKIKSGMVPITQVFQQVTDTVKLCGPVAYQLIGNYPTDALSLDTTTLKLTLWTQTGLDVGTFTAKVLATLKDYPILNPTIGLEIEFTVKIDSDCLHTELFPTSLDPAYYMDW